MGVEASVTRVCESTNATTASGPVSAPSAAPAATGMKSGTQRLPPADVDDEEEDNFPPTPRCKKVTRPKRNTVPTTTKRVTINDVVERAPLRESVIEIPPPPPIAGASPTCSLCWHASSGCLADAPWETRAFLCAMATIVIFALGLIAGINLERSLYSEPFDPAS